jgi:hypothetical protein
MIIVPLHEAEQKISQGIPTPTVTKPASRVLVVDGGQWDIGSQADANIGKVRNETIDCTTPNSPITIDEHYEDGLHGWGTIAYRDNDRTTTLWCDGYVSHVTKGEFKHKHFNSTL